MHCKLMLVGVLINVANVISTLMNGLTSMQNSQPVQIHSTVNVKRLPTEYLIHLCIDIVSIITIKKLIVLFITITCIQLGGK